MVRKRAAGAGAKPKGPISGKAATITTRITPETRAGLQREADRSGRSLSQEIELRLMGSLGDGPFAKRENYLFSDGPPKTPDDSFFPARGLALMAVEVARAVDIVAGQFVGEPSDSKGVWTRNPYAGAVFRALLGRVAEQLSAKAHPATADEGRVAVVDPDALADAMFRGMIDQLALVDRPPLGHGDDEFFADSRTRLPMARDALQLSKEDFK